MYNPASNRLLMGAAGVLALCVFVIDAFTPLDFAIAVVYVLVILLVQSPRLRPLPFSRRAPPPALAARSPPTASRSQAPKS